MCPAAGFAGQMGYMPDTFQEERRGNHSDENAAIEIEPCAGIQRALVRLCLKCMLLSASIILYLNLNELTGLLFCVPYHLCYN